MYYGVYVSSEKLCGLIRSVRKEDLTWVILTV